MPYTSFDRRYRTDRDLFGVQLFYRWVGRDEVIEGLESIELLPCYSTLSWLAVHFNWYVELVVCQVARVLSDSLKIDRVLVLSAVVFNLSIVKLLKEEIEMRRGEKVPSHRAVLLLHHFVQVVRDRYLVEELIGAKPLGVDVQVARHDPHGHILAVLGQGLLRADLQDQETDRTCNHQGYLGIL